MTHAMKANFSTALNIVPSTILVECVFVECIFHIHGRYLVQHICFSTPTVRLKIFYQQTNNDELERLPAVRKEHTIIFMQYL